RNARRLRRLYSAPVSMISCLRNLSPVLCASLLAASLLAGCAAVRPVSRAAAPPTPGGDASALTVIAEVALKRGDCRAASEAYAHAATVAADVQLARRATRHPAHGEEHDRVDGAAAGGVRCARRVDGHERGAGAAGELTRDAHTVGRAGAGCVRR